MCGGSTAFPVGLARADATRIHGGLPAGHFCISTGDGWQSIAEGSRAAGLLHWDCHSLKIESQPEKAPCAGDAVGRADLKALENLCREFPDNRFLVSVLSRENQHELCVYARKFNNLMPFGCWWFMNNPSIVEEITRERIEMLGTSFIPQHSDARVLEQVIYKWNNTRRTMSRILSETYRLLSEDGRSVTRGDIQRDVTRLFRSNAEAWTGMRAPDSPSQT